LGLVKLDSIQQYVPPTPAPFTIGKFMPAPKLRDLVISRQPIFGKATSKLKPIKTAVKKEEEEENVNPFCSI